MRVQDGSEGAGNGGAWRRTGEGRCTCLAGLTRRSFLLRFSRGAAGRCDRVFVVAGRCCPGGMVGSSSTSGCCWTNNCGADNATKSGRSGTDPRRAYGAQIYHSSCSSAADADAALVWCAHRPSRRNSVWLGSRALRHAHWCDAAVTRCAALL
jgi:hypothetical protein